MTQLIQELQNMYEDISQLYLLNKVGRNKYLFGTRNIEVFQDAQGAFVKTKDGGNMDLEDFLSSYHDRELQKLDALGDNEELVVDEQDDYKYQANIRMKQATSERRYDPYEDSTPKQSSYLEVDDASNRYRNASPSYNDYDRESINITKVNTKNRERRLRHF
jgi:hypothetical protein